LGLSGRKIDVHLGESRVGSFFRRDELGVRPSLFLILAAGVALAGGLFAWSLARIPILALAGAAAGAYAPFGWARRRRERAARERERGWPAALTQLADALEAGIAFPAAVALVAEAGPVPLRRD